MQKEVFGSLLDGSEVLTYTFFNKNGLGLKVTPYGCRIIELLVPDKKGNTDNVVLAHKTLEEYFGEDFHGAVIGRYANRIGSAEFSIKGRKYQLPKNDGDNSLHGGPGGFYQLLWDVKELADGEEPYIVFGHTSPDGDQGYPGKLDITVRYTLTAQNGLLIEYSGKTDMETIFNPTNHAFFNLSGNPKNKIYDTVLQLNSKEITEVTDQLIPTGKILNIAGTALDFSQAKAIGKDIGTEQHIVRSQNGYDHNFCIEGSDFRRFGEAYDPGSGRLMELYSSMPGVQLYTFNSSSDSANRDGTVMLPHTAFCLETQYYPDSPNHSKFPFSTLNPGETFESKTEYRFSVV